ncbi:MAG: alanine racemase [Solirubrobacteraceae bacterium]|jgi:alanine racemase|nr:alanine racemase [Solirubrobacteraceae bacterium]
MAGRAQAGVSAAALAHNVARLRRAVAPQVQLCAVVKADGYGHGATLAAQIALQSGAGWLAVATADEAAALRAAGLRDARLLVLGALSAEELVVALEADADVVIWREEILDRLPAGARVHVKLDTGMGRLGTRDPDEATRVADSAARSGRLAGLMTHFATADDLADGFLDEQLARFTAWVAPLRERHPSAVVHAANSAATLREPAAHFDLVRPGVALYGLDPYGVDPAQQDLVPALRLTSYVAEVKACRAGESAGYGRRFVADRDTVLATVPIGYGDGWRRGLTNDADGVIRGRRFPLVGTVSMDNVTFDLGPDGGGVQRGDEVVLLGDGITAEEVARRLGTINYEVTCGLTARVPRVAT